MDSKNSRAIFFGAVHSFNHLLQQLKIADVAICGTRTNEPTQNSSGREKACDNTIFRMAQSGVDSRRSSIRYAADFLPLTINACAGKLIVPLSKYLHAASATACFTVGS